MKGLAIEILNTETLRHKGKNSKPGKEKRDEDKHIDGVRTAHSRHMPRN